MMNKTPEWLGHGMSYAKERAAEMSETYKTVILRDSVPCRKFAPETEHGRRAARAAESIAENGFVMDVVVQHDEFLRMVVGEARGQDCAGDVVRSKYPFVGVRPDAVAEFFEFDDPAATIDGRLDKIAYNESARHMCARIDPTSLTVNVCRFDGSNVGLAEDQLGVFIVFKPDPDWSVLAAVPKPSGGDGWGSKLPDGNYVMAGRIKATKIACTAGSTVISHGYGLPISAYSRETVNLIRGLSRA